MSPSINPLPSGHNMSYAYIPVDADDLLINLNKFIDREIVVRFTPTNETKPKDVKAFLEYFVVGEEFNSVVERRYNLISMFFKGDLSNKFKHSTVTQHDGKTTTHVIFVDGQNQQINTKGNVSGLITRVMSPEVYKRSNSSKEPSYVNRIKKYLK